MKTQLISPQTASIRLVSHTQFVPISYLSTHLIRVMPVRNDWIAIVGECYHFDPVIREQHLLGKN